MMLACIDDFDAGTMWEMGYFYMLAQASGPPKNRILAFSTQQHGLNIMLAQSCDGFLASLTDIERFFKGDESVLVIEWKGKQF